MYKFNDAGIVEFIHIILASFYIYSYNIHWVYLPFYIPCFWLNFSNCSNSRNTLDLDPLNFPILEILGTHGSPCSPWILLSYSNCSNAMVLHAFMINIKNHGICSILVIQWILGMFWAGLFVEFIYLYILYYRF